MADDKSVSEEQRKRIKKIIKDRAPSTRKRSSQFVFWEDVGTKLGQPFNFTNIPLSKLYEMQRDPTLAFAMHYARVPILRAPWRIEGTDAQVNAFVENSLKEIYSSLVLDYLNSWSFGYQGEVKRFKLAKPEWTYIDPADETATERKVWDYGNVDAVVWDTFVPLPPELCEPNWNKKGEFDGIIYEGTPGEGMFPFEVSEDDTIKIPLEASLWFTNEKESAFGCQPYDETILTVEDGYVPIGEVDPDKHTLVSYNSGKIYRYSGKNGIKGHKFVKAVRPFKGSLLTIQTENSKLRTTPNHKFTTKWSEDAKDKHVVYLMRRGNNWRVGVTKLLKQKKGQLSSGVRDRLKDERADEAWIVYVGNSRKDVLKQEQIISHTFHIPDLTFRVARQTSKYKTNDYLVQEDQDEIWDTVDSYTGAKKLLDANGLEEEFPFYKNDKEKAKGCITFTSYAANIIDGLMEIPVDEDGISNKIRWERVSVSSEYFEGDVYSIDIPPYHHYISGGAITQNSVYGFPRVAYAYPYWWSYWFRWALADRAFEKSVDPTMIARYPDDVGVLDSDGDPIDPREIAFSLGEAARSNDTVAMPSTVVTDDSAEGRSTGIFEWDLEQIESKVNFEALHSTFEQLEVQKIKAVWVPPHALSSGSGDQSARNVAAEMTSSLKESQAVTMAEIDEHINKYMIPQLIELNFPEKKNITCKKVTTGFASNDIELSKALVQLLGQQDPEKLHVDIKQVLEEAGVPILTPQQIKLEEEKALEQAQLEAEMQSLSQPQNNEINGIPGPESGAESVWGSKDDIGFEELLDVLADKNINFELTELEDSGVQAYFEDDTLYLSESLSEDERVHNIKRMLKVLDE